MSNTSYGIAYASADVDVERYRTMTADEIIDYLDDSELAYGWYDDEKTASNQMNWFSSAEYDEETGTVHVTATILIREENGNYEIVDADKRNVKIELKEAYYE